jgi:hypothetical protein
MMMMIGKMCCYVDGTVAVAVAGAVVAAANMVS